MPKLQVNFDDVAVSEVVPEGRFSARIDNVEERTGKTEPHNTYWNVEFTIQDEPVVGRKVWDVFMLQPQSLWKLKRLMQCANVSPEGRMDLDSDELLGQEVGVVVAHEAYEGQARARVKGYFNLTTG